MTRFINTVGLIVIALGFLVGMRFIGSIIHYNCVYVAEDCAPPIKGVGEIGWYLTGGSLLPLWNHDRATVTKITWLIEKANPEITDEGDYRVHEQNIAAEVTTLDGRTTPFELGTAYGCTAKTMEMIENRKIMLGTVECYFALSGTRFAAFVHNGRFFIERYDESAEDGSIQTTPLVEI